MNWFQNKLYTIAISNFHRMQGLISAIILITIFLLTIYTFLLPQDSIKFGYYCIFIVIIVLGFVGYWLFFVFHYSKRSKDKLGIMIAINVESLNDLRYYNNDFLEPFKAKISDLKLPFDIIVLKDHQIKKITNKGNAKKALYKTKSHFCVWGSIKRRDSQDGENYIFATKGLVVHEPIREVQKVLLEKDFGSLLPRESLFETNLQYQEFKFKAGQLFYAVDFIVGRAALLSGDFDIAIKLHEVLLLEIKKDRECPISRDAIETILSIEYDLKASFEYVTGGYDSKFLDATDKSLNYNENNYGALVKKAISVFDNGNGNKDDCIRILNRARSNNPGTHEWLYGKAFIFFWYEDYDNAIQCCERIRVKNYLYEDITVDEIIDFNKRILLEQDKPQLYYWMGFVSFTKGSRTLADTYFQNFIDSNPGESMELLEKKANKYLKKIKKEIGY